MATTIRFGDLVRGSGRPQAVTLWTNPKKDRSFSKAVHENRVITIHSDPASHHKEYGQIGFHEEKGATYLVFPKGLRKDSNSRIVGINYQLAEEAAPKGQLIREERPGKGARKTKLKIKASERAQPATISKPKPKIFQVIVRRTATVEEMKQVKAITEEAARGLALTAIKHKRFALNRAVMRDEVVSTMEEK